MSSLGEFLNAMVELRRNKAQVAEYNANQQIAGMDALGEGIGGFLGNLGKGMEGRQNDALANQLYNRQNPPRAQAVNQALQAGADTTVRPGQISYDVQPMTQGGPFTGGVKGLGIQQMLDKSDRDRERLAAQGQLNEARIAHMGALTGIQQTDAERRQAQLELNQQIEARRKEQGLVDRAKISFSQASKDFQQGVKDHTAYTTQMTTHLAAAAGAKDEDAYQKAISMIDSVYNYGQTKGYKVSYPQVPIPAYKKAEAQTLEQEIARKQGQYNASWGPATALKESIAQKQAQLKGYGDYNYQTPGLQPWNIPPDPGEAPKLEDYLGPSQAQQQEPAPSAATPGGGAKTISLEEAKKINPGAVSGKYLQTRQGTFYIQ